MLVKNTIIALMAVAPALSIPVPAAGAVVATKAPVAATKPPVAATKPPVAATKATVATKATSVNPTAQRVSKAAVSKAEGNVDRDVASEKSLRAQLKAADARLIKDATSARKLEKAESAQEASDKAARKSKALKTPGSKQSTKMVKISNKSLTGAHKQSLNHHSTSHVRPTHHSSERILRNKHNLHIDTSRTHKHNSLTTPGSARTSKLTGIATPGSARTSKLTGQSQSGLSGPGTGFQSQYSPSGPWTGFQSPPFSGGPNGMTEDISYTPAKSGGGFTESIRWRQPTSARRLARRATIPATPGTPTTPTTPVSPPLSPLAALLQKQRTRKSAKVHQHTITESMQLSQMLVEAEKVVNGLEEQMNKRPTVFHNLKRKSALKRLRAPTTPTTPVTPVTPSAVKST